MCKSKFNALRKQLPAQYAKLIAGKLDGISNRQVLNVFHGQTTDPEKVEKILRAARELAAQIRKNKRLASNKKRIHKAVSPKPTV